MYLVDQNTGVIDLIYHNGLSEDFVKNVSHYEPDSLNARIIMAGKPVFETYPNAVMNSAGESKLKEGIRVLAILPIMHQGKVVAVINLASHEKNSIPANVRSALEIITLQFGGTISRLKAEDEIRNIIKQLNESNSAKDKLFSIVAHDLRGPFAGFMELTETMSQNLHTLTQEEIVEYSSVMHDTSKRLFDLLTNLLDWSRLQTGRIQFRPEKVNLFCEVEIIISLFSSAAASKGIHTINMISQDTHVYSDINMLSTVLRNLLSNATKFTLSGGTVKISSEKTSDQTWISVSDTGIGIPAEKLDMVLKAGSFYTTRGTNGESGSGFGLILCRELVEKNEGQFYISSTPGQGSTFSFSLPSNMH